MAKATVVLEDRIVDGVPKVVASFDISTTPGDANDGLASQAQMTLAVIRLALERGILQTMIPMVEDFITRAELEAHLDEIQERGEEIDLITP